MDSECFDAEDEEPKAAAADAMRKKMTDGDRQLSRRKRQTPSHTQILLSWAGKY